MFLFFVFFFWLSVSFAVTAPPNPSPTATKEYDVVAVIGLSNSYSTGFAASVLSASEVPFFGVRATSDALYEKSRYPYFVRVMPPDT